MSRENVDAQDSRRWASLTVRLAVFVGVLGAALGYWLDACFGQLTRAEVGETSGQEIELLDTDAPVPELTAYAQSGPNDVRDLLILDDGFLVATGTALIRYRYSGGKPAVAAQYTAVHGLPSGNCYQLRRDAESGVWAFCQGGVAYLEDGTDQWIPFTDKSGLAPGSVTNMALSADGRRVWVSSTGGLATALVRDRRWRVFPAKNPIDILVHPTQDVVWCRRLLRSRCMCGRHVLTSQFDLTARTWLDVPRSGNCAHVAPTPAHFSLKGNLLWLSGGYDPPLLFDPKEGETRTWPKEPKWERIVDGNVVVYSDWFGEMLPSIGNDGEVWFATNAGLWRCDPKKNEWRGHLFNKNPGCGQALLTGSSDGRTLYWECEGNLAAYEIPTDKWTHLWHVEDESYGEGNHSLTLCPDGKSLWLIGLGGVFVGEPASRKAVSLNDNDQPGLSAARFVRFDSNKRLALIATPRGVICADYRGTLRFALSRPAPPIHHRVVRFAFAPDGSEVWCLMVDEGGFPKPAAVLHPSENRWEEIPGPTTSGRFYDVVFAPDGKAVWLSYQHGDERRSKVVQRRPGDSGWKPFRAKMPDYYGPVEKFWLTPTGNEIWMDNTGCGLLRVKLATGEVTQYVQSDFRRLAVSRHYPLVEDYVQDLAFTSRGKVAVCSASGGGNHGITQIDLPTGKATSFSVEPADIEKLVAAPDSRTVWCVFNNSLLWAFDVQTQTWTHKCWAERDMPLSYFRTLECSSDGRFVWIRGSEGVGIYSVADKSWTGLLDDEWQTTGIDSPPLHITSDGKSVLCGHQQGVALIEIDGSAYDVLSPGPDTEGLSVSHIVPIPGTNNCVCAISHPQVGGVYSVDVKRRTLRKLKDLAASPVSAMAIGPDGFLWGGVPGGAFCVNPSTGEDRGGLEALRAGEPIVKVLDREVAPSTRRIMVAPRTASKGSVAPRPKHLPSRPSPTSLQNKGMVWVSTHVPVVATSTSGKTYVTWYAHAQEDAPAAGGLPQIPNTLLPEGRGWGGTTGISIHDGEKWLPPQLLMEGEQYCDVRFAWCQNEDLHLLIKTAHDDRLYHLAYQPSKEAWARLHILDHDGWTYRIHKGTLHLGEYDYSNRRVAYRAFDGKDWSKPIWLDARGDFDGLALAVEDDGTAHLVWKDGGAYVAHAAAKNGNARHSRQEFAERPIAYRDFAVSDGLDGALIMAYRAELYEGHPDRHAAHIRTWDGQSWSSATVIPFDTSSFGQPILLRCGRALLLSWVCRSELMRVYSALSPDDVWSHPFPLCSVQSKKHGCNYFVRLHADSQGTVHAAWCHDAETFHAIVGDLAQ